MSEQCPKCGAPRAETACPRCGLVYDEYDPDSVNAKVPSAIVELWAHVEQHWEDEGAHALFVEKALRADQAGFVAACYRQKGDEPIAAQQLEKLTQRLVQALSARMPVSKARGAGAKNVLYVFMFAIVAALVFLIFAETMK
ncbi:MAG: TFIIB-type zinc ribbon-containing protein [Deltaproteobacteria bacterium]|nr:TFIIB-type zinc ribbon-containing protein [Deltaproteobacteria bacterium]MBN2670465.1 TFIIB-type zinc ribbon-containing protein [Deltaproteobacteria bacterium]